MAAYAPKRLFQGRLPSLLNLIPDDYLEIADLAGERIPAYRGTFEEDLSPQLLTGADSDAESGIPQYSLHDLIYGSGTGFSSITRDSSSPYSGTYSGRATMSTQNSWYTMSTNAFISVNPSKRYRLNGAFKFQNTSNSVRLGLEMYDAADNYLGYRIVSHSGNFNTAWNLWTNISEGDNTVDIHKDCVKVRLVIAAYNSHAGSQYFYFDSIQLQVAAGWRGWAYSYYRLDDIDHKTSDAHEGTRSLSITGIANNYSSWHDVAIMGYYSTNSMAEHDIPQVSPNTEYAFSAWMRYTGSTSYKARAVLYWHRTDGSSISTFTTDEVNLDNTGIFHEITQTVTSPDDAAFCRITFQMSGKETGGTVYIDSVSLYKEAWVAETNCSLARETTRVYEDDSFSMEVTAIADGDVVARTSVTDPLVVIEGTTYLTSAHVNATAAREVQLGLEFFDKDGASLGAPIYSPSTTVSTSAEQWTLVSAGITAPTNAVTATFHVKGTGGVLTGEQFYVDEPAVVGFQAKVPLDTTYILKQLLLTTPGSTNRDVDIYVTDGNLSATKLVATNIPLPANNLLTIDLSLIMEAGEYLVAVASGDDVNLVINAVEVV